MEEKDRGQEFKGTTGITPLLCNALLAQRGQTLDLLANDSICHVKKRHSYRTRHWLKFSGEVNPEHCAIAKTFPNRQESVVFFSFSAIRGQQERSTALCPSTPDLGLFLHKGRICSTGPSRVKPGHLTVIFREEIER